MTKEQKNLTFKWLAGILVGLFTTGAVAWADKVNRQVEEIVALKVTVQFMQRDIAEIKAMAKEFFKK